MGKHDCGTQQGQGNSFFIYLINHMVVNRVNRICCLDRFIVGPDGVGRSIQKAHVNLFIKAVREDRTLDLGSLRSYETYALASCNTYY